MSKRFAVCDKNGVVQSVIIWDGNTQWSPPEGCFVVQNDYVNSGDWYDRSANKFTPFHEIKV